MKSPLRSLAALPSLYLIPAFLLSATPLIRLTKFPPRMNASDLLKKVQLLLDSGARVNARDRTGQTALWISSRSRMNPDDDDRTLPDNLEYRIVDLLLRHGARVNIRDDQGKTPLMHAASFGLDGVARRLLRAGANPLLTDESGDTALVNAKPRVRPILLRFVISLFMEQTFPEPPEEKRKRIRKAIEKLGSRSYSTREEASEALKEIGSDALHQLKRARGDDNPERSARVEGILRFIVTRRLNRANSPERLLPDQSGN